MKKQTEKRYRYGPNYQSIFSKIDLRTKKSKVKISSWFFEIKRPDFPELFIARTQLQISSTTTKMNGWQMLLTICLFGLLFLCFKFWIDGKHYFRFWLNWAKSSSELLWSYVVRPSVVNFSHFHLLLQNQWTYCHQIWHKTSLGKGDSSLFKWRAIPFWKGR